MKTRIRDLREDRDLTQNEVSKLLNISQVAYSYYELNKRNIPLDYLCKLADFYNVSVDYLLYRTEKSLHKELKRLKSRCFLLYIKNRKKTNKSQSNKIWEGLRWYKKVVKHYHC